MKCAAAATRAQDERLRRRRSCNTPELHPRKPGCRESPTIRLPVQSMEPLLAKPNYAFAKRQRDLAKKQKKEAKRQRKSESGQPAVAPDAEQAESDKKSDSQPS